MIYAVTPNGDIVSYPAANYLIHAGDSRYHRLLDKKDGNFVCDIPATWAISFQRPYVEPDVSALKAIKRALQGFDGRTGRWNT